YLECRRAGLCSVEHAEDLPTMFPLIYPNADLTTLHRDDIASLRRLYEDTESDTCTVSGKILAEDGKTELRGVEVVARNADPELENIDAIAFVSGAEAPRFSAFSKSRDNCTGDCGAYRITGLQPGHSYRICVQNILSEFSGSSGLEPVDPPVPLVHPACEEETFSCTCDSGDCDVFTGRDILTESFDPNADAGNFSQDQSSAGACSLTPQRFNGVWESTRLFSSKIFP
ncbi:MAG TPA: hypothetical protein DF383_05870, partial [Deltaproteobacteria bacterium]|nr:hypothetical protein [Deltaproteobacteria bacterium]